MVSDVAGEGATVGAAVDGWAVVQWQARATGAVVGTCASVGRNVVRLGTDMAGYRSPYLRGPT
jgi:hypothetical protein